MDNGLIINYDLGDKRFIHFLIPPNHSGIGIFREEKDKLLELAKNLGVNLSVKPFRGVLLKSGEVLVFKWFINHNNCPFLKNNECLIYLDRPLICRSFPLLPPFSCQPVPDKPVVSKYCTNSCVCDELLKDYNRLINKQNEMMEKINELIKKDLVSFERTSRVIRIMNDEKSVVEEL